jgi:Tetratricopeptide repeat
MLCFLAAAACSHGRTDLTKASSQDSFGVQMARMNLWREAMFRFQRAVELNPGDAMAHNNLAVAYEANGDFEKAAKEYRQALKLDRSNQYIQKNYSRYTEFMARNRKRQQREEAKAAAKAESDAPVAAAPPATTTVAPTGTTTPTPVSTTAAGATTTPPATTTAPTAPPAPPASAPKPATPPDQKPPDQTPPAQNPPPPPAQSLPGDAR